MAPKYTFGYIEKYIGATRMYGGTKTANMQQTHLAEAINILNEYYGNVPMEWIVTKILADHPDSLLRYIPKRVLMVIMRPLKKKVLRQVL